MFRWLFLVVKPRSIFGLDDALIGGLGGSLIGGLFGSSGQRSANETNIKLGREQMEFQERMSNTAYQRAVKDMQEAGLNPMLAYSQGGASAPVGSMPQVQNEASTGMHSAAQGAAVAQAVQQLSKTAADTDLVKAQADQVRSTTYDHNVNSAIRLSELEKGKLGNLLSEDQIRIARQELRALMRENESRNLTFDEDVAKRKYESQLKGLEVPAMKAEAGYWRKMESAPKEVKFLLDILQQVFGIRNSIRR
ncbi:MAG: DNA pilot protein [Arizlama microvirus]|nr:MAG: DNA pilot protein [Arizlama microvirus]